jgi:hypothetical protein
MAKYNLLHGGHTTDAYNVMHDAANGGIAPTRRQGGWSNYHVFKALENRGWLEPRQTGPRGGTSWYATRKGRYHLAKADEGRALT